MEKTTAKYGLHTIQACKGARKKKKLLGRGSSSGHGKTSSRGSKGQTSRAGRHMYAGFEGGQSPLIRRMPKRGFTSKFPVVYQVVNLENLNGIRSETITPETLLAKGLIKSKTLPVKVLGTGDVKKAFTVSAHAFSKSAVDKITKAGGKTEVLKNA